MHLFKQYAVRDADEAAGTIPVIDYGPYFAGEDGALAPLAAELRQACAEVGFFYAKNHGVPQPLVDRAFAASRRFHDLPIEEKLVLRLDANNIGYLPLNARCRAPRPSTRRRVPIRTRASSSATTAAPIIPTSAPASRCAGATNGPRGWTTCAPT